MQYTNLIIMHKAVASTYIGHPTSEVNYFYQANILLLNDTDWSSSVSLLPQFLSLIKLTWFHCWWRGAREGQTRMLRRCLTSSINQWYHWLSGCRQLAHMALKVLMLHNKNLWLCVTKKAGLIHLPADDNFWSILDNLYAFCQGPEEPRGHSRVPQHPGWKKAD